MAINNVLNNMRMALHRIRATPVLRIDQATPANGGAPGTVRGNTGPTVETAIGQKGALIHRTRHLSVSIIDGDTPDFPLAERSFVAQLPQKIFSIFRKDRTMHEELQSRIVKELTRPHPADPFDALLETAINADHAMEGMTKKIEVEIGTLAAAKENYKNLLSKLGDGIDGVDIPGLVNSGRALGFDDDTILRHGLKMAAMKNLAVLLARASMIPHLQKLQAAGVLRFNDVQRELFSARSREPAQDAEAQGQGLSLASRSYEKFERQMDRLGMLNRSVNKILDDCAAANR